MRNRDKIAMVWVRPERGLAKRLLKDPGWSVVYRDKVSILFREGDGESAHGAVASALRPTRTVVINSSGRLTVHTFK